MSFLYRTDEKIIRSAEILNNTEHPSQMRWHRLLDICREKGVSDGHFRTYMQGKNSSFDDADVMLFDCLKKGVMKITTQDVMLKSDRQTYVEYGEELDSDADEIEVAPEEALNKKYTYSIDTENSACKNLFQKYVNEQLKRNTDLELDYDTVMSNIKGNLLKYGEIEGLEEYFNNLKKELSYDFIKTYQVSTHNAYQKSNGFDYEIEKTNRNNIDSVKHTQKLNETLNGIDKFPELINDSNKISKKNIGDVLIDELKTEVIVHRGHSPFYVIFHPIKYYRESKSITDAKNALVRLGADRNKVEEFVENTKLEDSYLRDKNDLVKARAVRNLLLDLKFEDLSKDVEFSDKEIDELLMNDDVEIEEPFTKRLQEDIVKSENPVDLEVPENNEQVEKQQSVKEDGVPVEE